MIATIKENEKIILDLVNRIALHSNRPHMKVIHDHKGILLDLRVDQRDMKTFIGKQGNGIKSLRTIMQKMNNGSMLFGAIFMSIMIPKLLEKFSTLLTTPNTTKEKSRR